MCCQMFLTNESLSPDFTVFITDQDTYSNGLLGQGEAACIYVFLPTQPRQYIIYIDSSSKISNAVTKLP